MAKFGNLQKVNLRDIWSNEASDFTPWLAENINELGKALGYDLELKQREAPVGDFSLDILASEPGTNKTVVIENQLTVTDHDHLGKLLTYASGNEASIIIWIADSLREEHRQALEWLNRVSDENTEFFGVIIEVLRIDNSSPAYNFKPVVFPNNWTKRSKLIKNTTQVTERQKMYKDYFQTLIDRLRDDYNFTNAKVGQYQSWYSFPSGYTGITYGNNFNQGNRLRVELYINPKGIAEHNKALFDVLFSQKEIIEEEFGEPFEWERMDDKLSSRVSVYRTGSIIDPPEMLSGIMNWSIERLLKMKQVFGSRIESCLKAVEEMFYDDEI